MTNSLEGQFLDWKYGRGIIKDFIKYLSDDDLDKVFPRKNLNSIRKQCEELVQIQSCYVKALNTKRIQFSYSPLNDTSKVALLKDMDSLDSELEAYLNESDGSGYIDWFGEKWSIYRHFSAMIGHEQMHIGQIVAFCYAIGLRIPDVIKNAMALSD
ncbi:MAG: hypothetical protein GX783_02555 [Clostridiales bacterium]|nr:hypothetical protein [Clostridiales bacterium]